MRIDIYEHFSEHECKKLTRVIKEIIMTIADDILTIKADVAEIKANQTTPPPVDLSPVLNAQANTDSKVDAVQVTANDINAKLTPTP